MKAQSSEADFLRLSGASSWRREGKARVLRASHWSNSVGCIGSPFMSLRDEDAAFDRQWAMSLTGEALRQLEAEHRRAGREELFRQLRPFIQGDHEGTVYSQVAREFGHSVGTIKVMVHRLRQRFRELMRFLVLQTLRDPLQVEEELSHLVAALRR